MFVFVCGLVAVCCGFFVSCFRMFVVLLLCLVDPIQDCDYFVWEAGAHCFAFLWSVVAS